MLVHSFMSEQSMSYQLNTYLPLHRMSFFQPPNASLLKPRKSQLVLLIVKASSITSRPRQRSQQSERTTYPLLRNSHRRRHSKQPSRSQKRLPPSSMTCWTCWKERTSLNWLVGGACVESGRSFVL